MILTNEEKNALKKLVEYTYHDEEVDSGYEEGETNEEVEPDHIFHSIKMLRDALERNGEKLWEDEDNAKDATDKKIGMEQGSNTPDKE